jgi:hypothetical protein
MDSQGGKVKPWGAWSLYEEILSVPELLIEYCHEFSNYYH